MYALSLHDALPICILRAVAVHLSGGSVVAEPVQRLAGIGDLSHSAGTHHRTEFRSRHTFTSCRLRDALGEQDLRPGLRALTDATHLACLQDVDGLAAH